MSAAKKAKVITMKVLEPSRAEIERAVAATRDVGRALWAARDAGAPIPERSRLDRQLTASIEACEALREDARSVFADQRGVRVVKQHTAQYSRLSRQLRKYGLPRWSAHPVVDHPEILVNDKRQPIALLSHSYATREQIERYAVEHNQSAEFLDFSWYNPSRCVAVLFTPKESA
jgi:hypothetical protein